MNRARGWIKARWGQLLGALAALGALVVFWWRTKAGDLQPVRDADRALEGQQESAARDGATARALADAAAARGDALAGELDELEEAHRAGEGLGDASFAEGFNRRHGLRGATERADR